MDIPDLIIELIKQDMRHYQLILKLQDAGLDVEMHFLEISKVVAGLMGISETSDQWMETYISFLEQAPKFGITANGEMLKGLAEECYRVVLACEGK